MEYVLIYLAIGAATFRPMLKFDKACALYVQETPSRLYASWALWSVCWAFSLLVDALFWLIREPDDK